METADYFFDNQALDLQDDFQMVGYAHTWRCIKQNGRFFKHERSKNEGLGKKLGIDWDEKSKYEGLGKKLVKDCPLIMPK